MYVVCGSCGGKSRVSDVIKDIERGRLLEFRGKVEKINNRGTKTPWSNGERNYFFRANFLGASLEGNLSASKRTVRKGRATSFESLSRYEFSENVEMRRLNLIRLAVDAYEQLHGRRKCFDFERFSLASEVHRDGNCELTYADSVEKWHLEDNKIDRETSTMTRENSGRIRVHVDAKDHQEEPSNITKYRLKVDNAFLISEFIPISPDIIRGFVENGGEQQTRINLTIPLGRRIFGKQRKYFLEMDRDGEVKEEGTTHSGRFRYGLIGKEDEKVSEFEGRYQRYENGMIDVRSQHLRGRIEEDSWRTLDVNLALRYYSWGIPLQISLVRRDLLGKK